MARDGLPIGDAVLGQLLPAFEGHEPPRVAAAPRARRDGPRGSRSSCAPTRGAPTQLAALTERLHGRSLAGLPLLIAADQEGGQLVGLGHGTTRFPGSDGAGGGR